MLCCLVAKLLFDHLVKLMKDKNIQTKKDIVFSIIHAKYNKGNWFVVHTYDNL